MILLTKRTAALVWEPGTAKGFGCLGCADEIPFGLLNINKPCDISENEHVQCAAENTTET